MSCSTCPPEACFNGCVDITADACVRYTGNGSEALGISTGDSLLTVENILIDTVVSFLDGTGIDITINPTYYCELVSQYLPEGTPNLVEVLSALVRAACELQVQIDAIDVTLAELNTPYDTDCLSGVDETSTTHEVLQAVITKLCVVEADLAALALDLDTNYVKLADLDALIAAYLASQAGGSTQQSSKMVPYVAYEYYGSLTNFDGTGAGIPANGFNKVYLCNGLNGTPDKRGRVTVGAIVDVPPIGIGLDAAVNPSFAGNPNYALSGTAGANTIVLTPSQLANHSHNALGTATVTLNDPGHSHYLGNTPNKWGGSGSVGILDTTPINVQTTTAVTGITVTSNAPNNVSITVEPTGDDAAHSNIQPVIAAYYIMYIP